LRRFETVEIPDFAPQDTLAW